MSSDARQQRMRVISNYLRLFVTFAAGLAIVRLMAEIGPSALTVYLLLVSGTGFAFFFKVVMQESVVPILGLSYGDQENRSFAHAYWISFLLGVVGSVFAVLIFALIWAFSGRFDIGTMPAATLGIALATGALRTVASALATPPISAILIAGRVVGYNAAFAAERLADLVAVVLVLALMQGAGEAAQADAFFLLSAALYILVQVVAFAYARRVDSRFGVHPTPVRRDDLRFVRTLFGWNILVVVAFLLYLRLTTLVVNAHYGQGPTLVLGLVFLLIGYQRQISIGLVIGLDSIVARLYGDAGSTEGRSRTARDVILGSSYVQGILSFGSVTVLWVLADPLFRYWLGDSLSGSGWDVATAVILFRIMSIGVLARSLSENWMKILNGRGLVGTYSPWLLAGGTVYSFLMLVWVGMGAPVDTVLVRLAIAFSVLYTIVHLGVVPRVLCREYSLAMSELARVAVLPGAVLGAVFLVLAAAIDPASSVAAATVWLSLYGIAGLTLFAPLMMRWVLPAGVWNGAGDPATHGRMR